MRVARGVVNHCPRVQPMHHSVLPEEGGVEPRGRLSSSRQSVARAERVAKRNPELARVRTGGWCPFFVEVVGFGRAPLPFFPALASCAVTVFPCTCGSQFPFGRSRRRVNVGEVGLGNACCFRLRRAAKRNGAFAGRCCVFLRVAGFSAITALAGNGVSLITALACTQCTIPFCRKRGALNREGGRHR